MQSVLCFLCSKEAAGNPEFVLFDGFNTEERQAVCDELLRLFAEDIVRQIWAAFV